ncbi:USP34, partial [Cordylochernes scorpioides]
MMDDTDRVVRCLLEVLSDASLPCDPNQYRTGFFGKAQLVHAALTLLVSWAFSQMGVRVAILNHPDLPVRLKRLVLEDPEPGLRREACMGLNQLCLGTTPDGTNGHSSVPPLLLHLLDFLPFALAMKPTSRSDTLGVFLQDFSTKGPLEDEKEPYGPGCKDYFFLLCRLIDSMDEEMVQDVPVDSVGDFLNAFLIRKSLLNLETLAKYLADAIVEREYRETRHHTLEDDGLRGLLNLLTAVMKHNPLYKTSKEGEALVQTLFDCLFLLPSPTKRYLPKCKSHGVRSACFDLLVELVRGSETNYRALHAKLYSQHGSRHLPYPWDYWPHDDGRAECGYVGFTNLGATCYLASCMQHLYMMPRARASILAAKIIPEMKHESTLREIQRMFAYLLDFHLYSREIFTPQLPESTTGCVTQESERKAYNPRSFCKVYTMNHQPLNTGEQKDMAEFFTDLISKLEEMTTELLADKLITGNTSKGLGSEVHLDEDIQDILEYLYDSGSEIDDEVKDPDYENSASDELEFEEEEREEIPAKRPRLEVTPVRMPTTCRDTSTAAAGSNVAAGTWRKDDPSPPTPPPFTARPGLNLVGDVSSPFDAFSLFFTENNFKSIKEETNRYARSIIDRESKKGPLKPHGMLAKWKAVSVAQIKLFFCVIIHMSLVKKPGMKDYWSTHRFLKNAFCQSINMPRTLFMRILSMLHLNDNSKYIEYGKPGHDRLFKIRPVLESLIYSFGNAYTPQQNLTIDEAMCPFRGRVGFRVYIKGKPHKYGIKIFQISEAVSGYAYNLDIYTGKDPEQPEHNSIPNLVDRLAKRFYGQGYHIYFDRWFSSPELFDKLWEKKTLAVGTVMPSRKTMPKTEFSQKLKRGEIIKMRRKHLLAIKWKDVRDVFMLSTVHEGKMMPVKPKTPTREELFKPDAVIDYNKGKVGVDWSDQMMAYYSFSRKTLKWWKKIFFHLFSLCFVNGNIIYNKANPDEKISLKDFYLAVGGELLNQASIEHSEKETTSKTDVARLLGKHYCYKIAPESGKAVQRRCKVCADSAKHKTGKAARKDTRFECKQCKIPLCVGECFEKYHAEMKHILIQASNFTVQERVGEDPVLRSPIKQCSFSGELLLAVLPEHPNMVCVLGLSPHQQDHRGVLHPQVSGISVHPKALLKEMGRHDITFTADNAKDHYGGRKFRVHHDSDVAVQESLDELTVKDTLEGDNMYTCSQCGKKVRAEKRFLFNDAEVKPFDPVHLAAECFGGEMTSKTYDSVTDKFMDFSFEKTNSAYMLFYERVPSENQSSQASASLQSPSELAPESIPNIELSPELASVFLHRNQLTLLIPPPFGWSYLCFQWIWEDNMQFLQDKSIFEHTYFKAIESEKKCSMQDSIPELVVYTIRYGATNPCVCQLHVADLRIHSHHHPQRRGKRVWLTHSQVRDSLCPGDPDSCQGEAHHCAVDRVAHQALQLQPDILRGELQNPHLTVTDQSWAVQWFLQHMAEDPWWPIQILIKCPNQVVRQVGCSMLCGKCLNTGAAALPKALHPRDQPAKTQTFPAALSAALWGEMEQGGQQHVKHLTEYFTFLLEFSKMGEEESQFMLSIETISTLVNFYLKQKSSDCVEVVSDEEEEEEDEVAPTVDDRSKPASLEKMITLIAVLVEKSRTADQRLHLSHQDFNLIAGGKGFPFLQQQIRDSINLRQTGNLIFSVCRWNEHLAVHIINMIFLSIAKQSETRYMSDWGVDFLWDCCGLTVELGGCVDMIGLMAQSWSNGGFPQRKNEHTWMGLWWGYIFLYTDYHIYIYETVAQREVVQAAEYCPQQCLEWLTLQSPRNKIVHSWVLQSMDTWVEKYLIGHATQRVRNGESFHLPNPDWLGLTRSIQIYDLLLRLLKRAKVYVGSSVHSLWTSGTCSSPSCLNQLSQSTTISRVVTQVCCRADHDDQEVVIFNRCMLPAYYGLLRLCCQQSRSFTRHLASHQNIQWAFKNITPYTTQYATVLFSEHQLACDSPHGDSTGLGVQAINELFKLMKLFVARYPDQTEQEIREVATFKRTTLRLYLTVLDARACWATLISALRILTENNEDRLMVISNNGLPLLFQALHTLHMMFHEATACHVTGDIIELLAMVLELLKAAHSAAGQEEPAAQSWRELPDAIRRLLTLLNSYTPSELRHSVLDFPVVPGPFFPQRGGQKMMTTKTNIRPPRPIFQMFLHPSQLEAIKVPTRPAGGPQCEPLQANGGLQGVDVEYDQALCDFYLPYHHFIDTLCRVAIRQDIVTPDLVNLSAMVAVEGIPLHAPIMPKLWLDIMHTEDLRALTLVYSLEKPTKVPTEFPQVLHGLSEHCNQLLLCEKESQGESMHIYGSPGGNTTESGKSDSESSEEHHPVAPKRRKISESGSSSAAMAESSSSSTDGHWAAGLNKTIRMLLDVLEGSSPSQP